MSSAQAGDRCSHVSESRASCLGMAFLCSFSCMLAAGVMGLCAPASFLCERERAVSLSTRRVALAELSLHIRAADVVAALRTEELASDTRRLARATRGALPAAPS